MSQFDLHLIKDTLNSKVEAKLDQEPQINQLSVLKIQLTEILQDFNQLKLEVCIKNELQLGLIELILSLRKNTSKKITVAIKANDELQSLARNTGFLNLIDN